MYYCNLRLLYLDPHLTVKNFVATVNLMEEFWSGGSMSLANHLCVPSPVQDEIEKQHKSQEEQTKAFAMYVLQFIPGISWSVIAGSYFYLEEKDAMRAAMKFIQEEKGKTLIFCS